MFKKILVGGVLVASLFMGGCANSCEPKRVINDHGDEVYQYGRFIEIADTECRYDGEGGNVMRQVLVYDMDTKVIYIREFNYNRFTLTPFYCINEDGEAVIAIYNAEED